MKFAGSVGAGTGHALTSINVISGSTAINGGSVTTSGAQTYNAVSLGAGDTLTGVNINVKNAITGNANSLSLVDTGTSTLGGAVSGLTTLNTNAVNINGGSVTSSGAQTYGNITLGATTALTGVNLYLGGTVTGAGNILTLSDTGASTLVGNISGLNTLQTNAANINAASITSTGTQTYGGAVVFGTAATAFNTTNSNINFNSTVAGNDAISLSAGTATVKFAGSVGAGTGNALTSINVISGNTAINGGAVTTANGQTYQTVGLGNDTTLTGNNINIRGVVTGNAHALTLADSGSSTLGSAVNNLASILTNVVAINGGSVTTSGAQTYGTATLGTDAILTGNNITFGSTVGGNSHNLTLTDAGASNLDGAMSGLTSLTTNVVNINGGSITSSGLQSYGNATLGANAVLTGDNITFNGTVAGGSHSLNLADSGVSTLDGVVSGLSTLTTHVVTMNGGSITTSGFQHYGNAVLGTNTTLSGNAIIFGGTVVGGGFSLGLTDSSASTFNGAVSGLSTLSTDVVNINGGSVTSSGAQTYGNATLGNNAVLTGNDITFSGTVTGNAHSLNLADAGTSVLDGAVSGVSTLQTNVVDINGGAVTTSGSQNYGNAALGNATTLTGNNITFNGTLNGGANNLTVNDSGTTTLTGATSNLASVDADAVNINGGAVTTTGEQTYNDNVSLGQDTVLTGNNITFDSTVNANSHNLTLSDVGTSTFNGAVSNLNNLQTNNTDINGGSVSSSNSQNYTGSVLFGADANLTSTSGNLNFSSTVNGGTNNITLNSGNATSFLANVTNMNNLIIASTNDTTFASTVDNTANLQVTSANIAVNGGVVTTTNNQKFVGAVTAGQDTTFSGASVGFTSTLNNNGNNLTINDTSTTAQSYINGVLSGAGSLTKTGLGTLKLNNGANSFTGATYINGGVLSLGANNALASTVSVNVSPNDTFDLAGYNDTVPLLTGSGLVTLGAGVLTINNAANVNDAFSGSISGSGQVVKTGTGVLALSGASSYSGGTAIQQGVISLTSNTGLGAPLSQQLQTSGVVTVSSGAELDLSNDVIVYNPMVLYGSGISGNGALMATGDNSLYGNIVVNMNSDTLHQIYVPGSTDNLYLNGIISGSNLNKFGNGNLLVTNAANSYADLNLDGGTFTAVGGTSVIPGSSSINLYNSAQLVYSNITDIVIGSLAGNGTVNFNSSNLTIGDDLNTSFYGFLIGTGNVSKVGNGLINLFGTTSLTGNTDITAGGLNFASNAILGNLTVENGAFMEISHSAVTANSVTLNGLNTLSTNGISSYTGALAINANSSIATTGTLAITGDINSSQANTSSLTFTGDGAITENGSIGNLYPLASLITSTSGSFYMNGLGIYTTGSQDYNDPITLLAGSTFDSSNQDITINSTVDGGYDLTLTSATAVNLNGAIGSNAALNKLTTNTAATNINAGTITTLHSQIYNNQVNLLSNTLMTAMYNGDFSLLNGISGGSNNLTLTGVNGTNKFNLAGGVALNNLEIDGGANGNNVVNLTGNFAVNSILVNGQGDNNTLSVQTTSPTQNWFLTSLNGGYATGIAANNLTFNDIWNIAGSATNTNNFTLNGGTITGSLTGGTGVNTLTADNLTNSWLLTGLNSGSLTGVGSFSQIQNLIGGNSNNTFSFFGNAAITGMINGTNAGFTNTLDYSAYTNAVNVYVTGSHTGTVQYNNYYISNFVNMTNLVSNGGGTITVAGTNKNNVVHITGAGQGYVNDPLVFSGFSVIANNNSSISTKVIFDAQAIYNSTQNTAYVNGTTFSFIGIPNVAGVITAQVNPSQSSAIVSAVSASSSAASSAAAAASSAAAAGGQSTAASVSDNLTSISNDPSTGGGGEASSGGGGGSSSSSVASSSKVSTNCS